MLCLRAKARRQRKMLPPKVSCDLDHNGHELVDSLMLIYESGFAGDQRHRDDDAFGKGCGSLLLLLICLVTASVGTLSKIYRCLSSEAGMVPWG